jgi:hypothetical protein
VELVIAMLTAAHPDSLPVAGRFCAVTPPDGAGTIIGSGTISNEDASAGTGCIAEQRAIEILKHGETIAVLQLA